MRTIGWALALAAAGCAGSDTDDERSEDSALPSQEDSCEVDLECCNYACRSETFWSTYDNDCTCDPKADPGDPNRECTFIDGSCAFTE